MLYIQLFSSEPHVASNVRYVTHLGVQTPHNFDLSSYGTCDITRLTLGFYP